MKYHALAIDYDGTLATDGVVDEATLSALRRLRESGRRVILATGRNLEQLLQVFPQIGLCHLVVADNGGLLYDPATEERTLLVDPPSREIVNELVRRGVPRIEVGDVVIGTWEPYEDIVLAAIRDLGLELQIIFNKGAVMILPTGINKASGLRAALEKLGLSHHNTVGVGDAENDEAFLRLCDVSAAVENALDVVKKQVDLVLHGARGAGVTELIDRILDDDLNSLHRQPQRGLLIGRDLNDEDFRIPVYGTRVLVTGGPASGKSGFATTVLEQLREQEYQFVVVDPEGDYLELDDAIVLGSTEKTPAAEEVIQVIKDPGQNCVISLFATAHDKQPAVFAEILQAVREHRGSTGRPHWYIVDEAHYPLPAKWEPVKELHLDKLSSVMYITAFIDRLPESLLDSIDLFVAIADRPMKYLHEFCALVGAEKPELAEPSDQQEHRAVAWWRNSDRAFWFQRLPPSEEHQRHRHGYLEGDMDLEHRFWFRGPRDELKLGVQNLKLFMQIGEGVDDETWHYHLKAGDYANWFRDIIKDDSLAELADRLSQNGVPADQSREQIFEFIRQKYMHET